MQKRSPDEPAPDALPDAVAERLLERASELDATLGAAKALADLRATAAEAGISTRAFDAAVAELQSGAEARASNAAGTPRRRSRLWVFAAGAVAMVAAGVLTLTYGRTPTDGAGTPGVPMVEEAVLLRCLAPGEAAELIRPLLRLPGNRVAYSPEHAPRVLTIRGTTAQLQRVESKLDELEAAGSPACATRPTGRMVS